MLPGAVVYMEYDPMEVAGLCVSFICLNRVATFSDADGNAQAVCSLEGCTLKKTFYSLYFYITS